MNSRLLILVSAVMVTFSSCTKKLDGTSEESMQKSMEEMKQSLSSEKKANFKKALLTITFNEMDLEAIMNSEAEEMDGMQYSENLRNKLDGMTADEIIAKAEKIRQARKEELRQEEMKEVTDLYSKQSEAKRNRKKLKQFKVLSSKFYKRESYLGDEPVIDLVVKNGTSHAVSRAYFKGTLASPGREVPWLVDEFNYKIPGGIEPGEKLHWKLASNSLTDWGTVDAPKDAELKVKVTRLDDAQGEELFSVEMFDEEDEKRLRELLKKYPELEK